MFGGRIIIQTNYNKHLQFPLPQLVVEIDQAGKRSKKYDVVNDIADTWRAFKKTPIEI